MMTPLVGLPACTKTLNGHLQHATPARYGAALMGAACCVPVLIPPVGQASLALLDRLDGLLVPGSPSNVHPSNYGVAGSETPDWHDPARDETVLPLIREALRRGLPLLAICRGHQELNVALGGSLHQRVGLLPGRLDHDGQGATHDEEYALRHPVALSGNLARLLGATGIQVNSVHGQAIDRMADDLVAEAIAPDGTIEAVRVAAATSFAYGVQWHPEWRCLEDANSTVLFRAFGDACRAYAGSMRQAAPAPSSAAA